MELDWGLYIINMPAETRGSFKIPALHNPAQKSSKQEGYAAFPGNAKSCRPGKAIVA